MSACEPLVMTSFALALAATLTTADAPTYADDVAAIVHTKCSGCHRPGQSGPFSLLSYKDVDEHADTIAAVIEDDYMPPWPPSDASPSFRHDRRLSKAERETILEWVAAGAPSGDLASAPALPKFTNGWMLGEPDLVLTMDEAFPVPADGRDIYRWFSLPVDSDKDLYIKAFEFRASSNGVVHHALIYADRKQAGRGQKARDGKPGFRGMRVGPDNLLGGFVPGAVPSEWPEDLAVVLPAGSDLVLQTHFHPNGKADNEKSTVGVYLADKKPSHDLHTIQVPPGFGRASGLDIPPNDSDYTVVDSFLIPCDVRAIGTSGHAHYICEKMTMTATLPGGEEKTILDIQDWDLDWQGEYHFAEPFNLPAGTVLRTTLVYDNSSDNLDNPFSPPKRVRWGEESTDEMGSIDLVVVTGNNVDDRKLKRSIKLNRLKVLRPGNTIDPNEPPTKAEQQRFAKLDKNGNGSLQRSEVPRSLMALFELVDANEDGDVTPKELMPIRRILR